jgi:type III secretory pathway component EscT
MRRRHPACYPATYELDQLDPHERIAQLEATIERLATRIENCRKFVRPAQIAVLSGSVVLVAMMFGAIRSDATLMTLSIAAALGGLVLLGSNRSTANEAKAQLAAAQAHRDELINQIGTRLVEERPTPY